MIKSICINNKNKPPQIPDNLWVKQDEQYTITYIYRSLNPNSFDELMVDLKEIKMDSSCKPYEFYRLNRFAISADSLEEFILMCKTTAEFNDFEIEKLLEETLQTIKN